MMDSAVEKRNGGMAGNAATILNQLAACPDLKCDACLKMLINPVTLPCDHYFCDSCFDVAAKIGDDGFECLICQKISMPLPRCPLLIKFCEIFQKYEAIKKNPVPLNSEDMLARGLRAPKRPVRYDSPEPMPVKRRRGKQTNLDDISVTSAKALEEIMTQWPVPHAAVRPGLSAELSAELPPQTPTTKVGSWLRNQPSPRTSATRVLLANKNVEHSDQPQRHDLSDSGVLTGDSAGCANETLPAGKPRPRGRKPRDKAETSVLQNSTGSVERSPGWNRVKKAKKELQKNDVTLKALDVSGGELSKRPGLASRNHTLNVSNNETAKEVPLKKAPKHFNKNKTQAETSEGSREVHAKDVEWDCFNFTNDVQGATKVLPAGEKSKAAVEAMARQKEKADAERSALKKLKGRVEKPAQEREKNDSIKADCDKVQTEAAKDVLEKKQIVSKAARGKLVGVIEKKVPKITEAQEKILDDSKIAREEKDLPEDVVKDVSDEGLCGPSGLSPRHHTLNVSNNEKAKGLPVRKAMRRLKKPRAEIFQFGGETYPDAADPEGVKEDLRKPETESPIQEISQAAMEVACQQEKSGAKKVTRGKLKGPANKVGLRKTRTEAGKGILEKKHEATLNTSQEKPTGVVEKILTQKTKANIYEKAKPDPRAEEENLAENITPLPKMVRVDYDKSRLKIADAEELKVAQEMGKAYAERANIQKDLEDTETVLQAKSARKPNKGGRKKANVPPKSTAQKQATFEAETTVNELARDENERSEDCKIEPDQKSPEQRKRGRRHLAKPAIAAGCSGGTNGDDIIRNDLDKPRPAPRGKDPNQMEIDTVADYHKRTRDVENIIANHNSKKSLEFVTKNISYIENAPLLESSEDEDLQRDILLSINNRTPLNMTPEIHNVSYGVLEKSPEFVGFASLNESNIMLETLEQRSPDTPIRDNVAQGSNADVSMQIDGGELTHDVDTPLITKKVSARVERRAKELGTKKLPDTTIRKTFSLEADTQDLAHIAVNEEDSFEKKIHVIAEANKSNKTPTENVDKAMTLLTSTPIERKSTATPSRDMFEIDNVPNRSAGLTNHSSNDDLIEKFKLFLDKKLPSNENSGKNIKHMEFRNVRLFFIGNKGPFESPTGESLRGKRVFVELDPSSMAKEVRVQQNPDPGNEPRACNCKCTCIEKKLQPAAGKGDTSGDDSDQSMAVNYVPSYIGPASSAARKRLNQLMVANEKPPMVANEQPKCSQPITNSGKVDGKEIPKEKTTLPVNSQETQQSAMDTMDTFNTAVESFGDNSQRPNIRCTQGPSQVSASLRAAIEADDEGPSQIVQASQHVRMGMRGEGDSVQQNARQKMLEEEGAILPKMKATNKTALEHIIDPEPDFSQDFIPDTIPNLKYKSKILRPVPPPVAVPPPTVKAVTAAQNACNQGNVATKIGREACAGANTRQVVNRGFPYAYVPGNKFANDVQPAGSQSKNMQACLEASNIVMPTSQPAEMFVQPEVSQQSKKAIQPGVMPKNKEANNVTMNKFHDKPCPSFKQFTSSQAFIPRLTDPTLNAQCNNVFDPNVRKTFRRIKVPTDSSESEDEVPSSDIVSSEDFLPNRMSDNEDPDSLNILIDEHCRNGSSSPSEDFKMSVPFQAGQSRGHLPQCEARRISEKCIDSQRNVAVAHCDLGDEDNDVTLFDEFSEQCGQTAYEGDDDDDSDNIVKQTPERQLVKPQSARRVLVRPPPPMSRLPEESARMGVAGGMDLVKGDIVDAFPEAVFVVGSGLSTEETRLLLQMIKMVGATHDTEFSTRTTHLVAFTSEDGAAPRTVKVMMAIAMGAWVVSMAWVRACIAAKRLVLGMPYEVKDSIFGDSARRSRLGSNRLLKDFAFFLMPPYAGQVVVSSFKLILEYAGGTLVNDPSDKGGKKYLIALSEMSDKPNQRFINEAFMDKYKILMLSYSWIHMAICSYKLRAVWTHLPVDTTLKPFIRSSYPSQMFDDSTTSDEESQGSDDE